MKGFTLIELLAVIVILAIILMIATPMVLNVINDAKKSAAESSAKFFVKQAETQYMMNDFIAGSLVVTEGTNVFDVATVKVGQQPAATTSVTMVNGKVNGNVDYNGYTSTVTEGKVTATTKIK